MDVKLVLLIFVLVAIVFVSADFFYNPVRPKQEELAGLNLKCIPGRTVMKVVERANPIEDDGSSDEDGRRTHMNFPAKEDESCQICVCSVEGQDEYCSKRPAMNVNECLRMAMIKEKNYAPYDVDSVLSNRIRRIDLIYHNMDIKRYPTQKCQRGTTYYSNSPTANDTDIDVVSDINSLLDYPDKEICFYCICSTDGSHAGCLSRNAWYCEYFRYTRTSNAFEKRYGKLFQQDRPAYFTHLSYRIRRTMDEGMFQMVQGFKPSGTRGNEQQCVPFVSQYTDCTDENRCSGCKECMCNGEGQWTCENISQCLGMDSRDLDENSVDRAWETIEQGVKNMNRESAMKHGSPHIPRPQTFDGFNDELLAEIQREKYAHSDYEAAERGDIKEYIAGQMDTINERVKRSVPTKNDTHKVKFYHTVDEYNEDTLKQNNDSGTITAYKVVPKLPINSRRNGLSNKVNSSNPLQIEYNSPMYDHHIADNKIDTLNNEKHDIIKLQKIIGNKTKESKDKDLSKLIVNELKKGIEIVGDKNAPSISNITFIRENDTLTAMAFIAGNLLNKLWNMEKDNQAESIETDVMKHEKIADLIELFKEPLTLRQETFLKDALEHLADTMSKGADHQSNIPLCEQVEKIKADLGIKKNCTRHSAVENSMDKDKITDNHTQTILQTEINNDASLAAVRKLNNVMSLIQKYEEIQKNIKNVKTPATIQDSKDKMTTSRSFSTPTEKFFSKDENQSLNLYGNILDKITKLIVPKRKSKKILKAIKSQSIFNDDEDLKTKLKRIYDIDLENSTFTSKDKVVLDYLVNFRNKKCQLTENMYDAPTMEGGILQNLSEFLKVKSFVDLLSLLEPEKSTSTTELNLSTKVLLRSDNSQTTEAPVTITTILETTMTTLLPANVTKKDNLAQTKEKLKSHLKAIINDLLELQKASGMNSKDGNIKIAEALPCLYNLLNNNRVDDKKKYRMNKIKSVFDAMKDELKYPDTRRFELTTEPRPKSAAVWERIIKNANAEMNLKTRRSSDEPPQSFEDLTTLLQTMDDFSNTYKNYVILKGVIPRKRLSVLKTVDGDVRLHIRILDKIKLYLETTPVTPETGRIINEFLDNAMMNIDLDVNVLKNIFIHKERPKTLIKTLNYKKYQTLKKTEPQKISPADGTTTIKLSRDEIINQLIKNRVQFYLKVKELEGLEKDDDINVRLARKILSYLDVKNYGLARELFKVFVAQKQQNKTDVYSMPRPTNIIKTTPRGSFMGFKEPLIQFEEEKGPTMGYDMMALTKALMKQLENIKSMKS